MKKSFSTFMSAIVLFLGLTLNAQAGTTTIFTLNGVATTATGALALFVPPNSVITGPIGINSSALGGIAGVSDILSADINVGPGFCFTTDLPGNCPLGGAGLQIDSIDFASIDLLNPAIASGTLGLTGITSPNLGSAPVTVNFDFLNGTFFADGGALGTVSGTATLTQQAVVPIPAAMWLFGSALLGLAGLRRRA